MIIRGIGDSVGSDLSGGRFYFILKGHCLPLQRLQKIGISLLIGLLTNDLLDFLTVATPLRNAEDPAEGIVGKGKLQIFVDQ